MQLVAERYKEVIDPVCYNPTCSCIVGENCKGRLRLTLTHSASPSNAASKILKRVIASPFCWMTAPAASRSCCKGDIHSKFVGVNSWQGWGQCWLLLRCPVFHFGPSKHLFGLYLWIYLFIFTACDCYFCWASLANYVTGCQNAVFKVVTYHVYVRERNVLLFQQK